MAYDSTTANPVNPQGTAGGGNGFNIAPLFGEGSYFVGAAPSNSGSASTTSTDTAAATGGTAAPTVGASTTGGTAASSALWMIGIAGALLIGGLLVISSLFRQKS